MNPDMPPTDDDIALLKSLWTRQKDGRWGIHGMKSLDLRPQDGFERDYFQFESQMELLTNAPPQNTHDMFSSFGPTDFLLKQSILPVVAWTSKEDVLRCIGTAFVISCTGYIITASHVLLDPEEGQYGRLTRDGHTVSFSSDLNMGVIVPVSPARAPGSLMFLPFQHCWYWGKWKESPLIREADKFEYLTDIAICKIPELPNGAAHQPLNLSLNPFAIGEHACAIGYSEMRDLPIENKDGARTIPSLDFDLFVSVGEVMNNFPKNHLEKELRTPGPCFDFKAKIPGKMSGSPIFGGDGAVVRGVVSGSWSGEKHAYGSMLGPSMHLPLMGTSTIKDLMISGNEGIARVQGPGL